MKHTKDLTVVSRCRKCNRSRSFTFDERHTTKTECNFTNLYRVDVGVFVDETMVAAKLWNDAIGDQVLVTVVYVVSIRFHQSVSAETKKLGSEIYSNYKNQLYSKMASKQRYELNYDATRHYSNILCQRRLLTIHLSEHRNGRWLRFVVGRFSMTYYGMRGRIVFALYKTPQRSQFGIGRLFGKIGIGLRRSHNHLADRAARNTNNLETRKGQECQRLVGHGKFHTDRFGVLSSNNSDHH